MCYISINFILQWGLATVLLLPIVWSCDGFFNGGIREWKIHKMLVLTLVEMCFSPDLNKLLNLDIWSLWHSFNLFLLYRSQWEILARGLWGRSRWIRHTRRVLPGVAGTDQDLHQERRTLRLLPELREERSVPACRHRLPSSDKMGVLSLP